MSQEKTLLNNRISQLIEEQAKLHNAEVLNKSEQSTINLEKNNQELTQEVAHLKRKINDLLNQQESSGVKALYENKILLLEKEIQQLKHRYQSPETKSISHDHNDQQWKSIIEQKNREINDMRGVMTNLQFKITELNKEIIEASSVRSSPIKNHMSYETETELNNLRVEVKCLKRVNATLEEKLKYLISEGKKKDDFLK